MASIKNIMARQILDSRGNPTVEVDVILTDNALGRASVPSGASTGKYEALELRDNKKDYLGKGVKTAINNINNQIASLLNGMNPFNIQEIDYKMIDFDGTHNKSNLGANAILGVSLATVHAASNSLKQPLYEYLNNTNKFIMPTPMMNILNGGSHADNNVDIQEFMILPVGALTFKNAIKMGAEVFHNLKSILKKKSLSTAVGDEGGFAPNLKSHEEAIELILEAIESAGYIPQKEIALALDVAASELYDSNLNKYILSSENKIIDSQKMIKYYEHLCKNYPIISIEDGLDENDWEGWKNFNSLLGNKIQIVGDDLTVTNKVRLKRAIKEKSMNSILIKFNQIGTISETLETISLAQSAKMSAIFSHRSGETEDTTISDFSVATGVGQIKTGSLCRTDRVAKYNQLMRIEEALGSKCIYAGNNYIS
tara:strand:- start:4822 stop:6099 length:1278 start_codon:yes stop_codon:yes gene_type:complete